MAYLNANIPVQYAQIRNGTQKQTDLIKLLCIQKRMQGKHLKQRS